MSENRVQKFYDRSVEQEWMRLDRDYYHRLEFEVTFHFIDKYLVPGNRVADIGAGPGRYSLSLMEKGHEVMVVDLSENLLEKAKEEIAKRDLEKLCLGVKNLDAINLEGIESESFDVTLLFGPMYHLIKREDQLKALSEAKRITKKGGLIFTSIITHISPIKDMLTSISDHTREHLLKRGEQFDRIVKDGVLEYKGDADTVFTDAYFARNDYMPNLYKEFDIELVESFSQEGVAAFLGEKINELVDSKEVWDNLLDLVIQTSTEPALIGAGEHAVYVGKI